MREWPEPVRRVSDFLTAVAAEARVEEFSAGTPTAKEAARAAGCDLAQIVKSLVLVCDGRPVVAMVPGDRRADLHKVAAASGASTARTAGRDEVQDATGFEPGAVAPFPLPNVAQVLIDRTLLSHEVVWCGAGSDRHMVALAPGELARLSRARAVDAVQAGT